LIVAAAEHFAVLAAKAVEHHGIFAVALSGGSTPKGLYKLMATDQGIRARIHLPKIHFFFGDERHVPPDHSDSNCMANEAMFRALPPDQLHVHCVLGELSAAQAIHIFTSPVAADACRDGAFWRRRVRRP
jgi:6-phosphogluconolactonase